MGMEGQIMCIEQCTFRMSLLAFLGPQNAPYTLAAEASPQTSLGELTALPRPPNRFKGSTSNALLKKGEEGKTPK